MHVPSIRPPQPQADGDPGAGPATPSRPRRRRLSAHRDPSLLYGTLAATASALLTLVLTRRIEPARQPVVVGMLAVASPLLASMAIRRHAWAPETVEDRFMDAEEALGTATVDAVAADFEADDADLPLFGAFEEA